MRLREMVLCGLFIALVAVGALIRIPVGSDVYTLQFMFTLLAGLLLGARLGALAVGTYVVMGLVGIPVFASGGGALLCAPAHLWVSGGVYHPGLGLREAGPAGSC